MNVLIGSAEIAGWMQHFKSGFEALGHKVETAIFHKHPLYDYTYNYILDELFFRKLDKRELKKQQILQRLIKKIYNIRLYSEYRRFIFNLIDRHDLLLMFWHPFLNQSFELKYAKARNKKIISVFVGTDARYFRAFQQQYDVSQWQFPDGWSHNDPNFHLSLIRNAEKYSDIVYSVPDQAGLQLKPYYHIHVPVATSSIKCKVPKNTIPKVIHAPSIPYKKGTDIIEATLQQLKDEGLQFDFVSLRDMQNSEVLNHLYDADVVVDEIVYHGPGSLSFEAMLSGCAVATRYLQDSPACFQPPVCNINTENIYFKLRELLSDKQLIGDMAIKGREYAMKKNAPEVIISDMLRNLKEARTPDYYPRFLRYNYLPSSSIEADVINKWTSYVMECEWYKEHIKAGDRAGLKF